MITIVHGGQTGADRGAHEAAIDADWHVAGFMPRDGRDERGPIPSDVARFLRPHEQPGYAARTEANVQLAAALLVVVRDADDPRATPGTAKTIDLAARRGLRRMIVDPRSDAAAIARWIRSVIFGIVQAQLPLEGGAAPDLIPTRLLVAGPRESKWSGARVETAGLLRRVAAELHATSAARSAS